MMIPTHAKTLVLLTTLCLFAAPPATPQGVATTSSVHMAATKKPAVSKADKKSQIVEAARVSTAEAAKDASQVGAKKKNTPQDPIAPAVLEFQPAAKTDADANEARARSSKESGKSALKDVHGEALGSLDAKDPANHHTGAAVGASTKGHKTSVYVETESSHAASSPPR